MFFVKAAHEVAHIGPQDALHRSLLRRHDMDLDLTRPKSGGDFEPDEAGADDDRALRTLRDVDDRAAVRERAQRAARAADTPGIGSRTGSAPVASSRRSQGSVFPSASATCRDFASMDATSAARRRSMPESA